MPELLTWENVAVVLAGVATFAVWATQYVRDLEEENRSPVAVVPNDPPSSRDFAETPDVPQPEITHPVPSPDPKPEMPETAFAKTGLKNAASKSIRSLSVALALGAA